jgi:hypothetical protein
MALDQGEILEWEELARDIRSAYAQLVARFGKGTQFDGITWEEQRYYVARCLFLKWMGHQAMQNTSARNDSASTYLPASLAQTVSGPLSLSCALRLIDPFSFFGPDECSVLGSSSFTFVMTAG